MNGVAESDLVKISLSYEEAKTKLRWEHSREFEYQGNMYDIVKTHFTPDSVHYFCWLDKVETKLNNQLANLVDNLMNEKPMDNNRNKQIDHFFKTLIVNEFYDEQNVLICFESELTHSIDLNYKSPHLLPVFPPPKHFLYFS